MRFLYLFLLPVVLAFAEDHAPVGSRPLPPQAVATLQANSDQDDQATSDDEDIAGCCWNRFSIDYYPTSFHSIYTISGFGDALGIEDGSIWQISYADAYRVRYWQASDPIVITQNHSWISSYRYRIINKNLGQSVAANLSLGPILDSEFSRYIVWIDLDTNVVVLSDNTHWQVSWLDSSLLVEWALNDYIIIGVNTGWDSSCRNILINSNMDHFIRAKQI